MHRVYSAMEKVRMAGTGIVTLFSAACILKLLLPGGTMKRSAIKAVDIVTLVSLIRIVLGVLSDG